MTRPQISKRPGRRGDRARKRVHLPPSVLTNCECGHPYNVHHAGGDCCFWVGDHKPLPSFCKCKLFREAK
jgi:hypothetical protein